MTTREKLQEIDEHGEDLTGWERKFLAEMLQWTDRLNPFVSPKQEATINRIFQERLPERWQ